MGVRVGSPGACQAGTSTRPPLQEHISELDAFATAPTHPSRSFLLKLPKNQLAFQVCMHAVQPALCTTR